MGQVNAVMKHYCSDKVKFADLMNGIYFKGREVILPEELLEGNEVYYEPSDEVNEEERRKYLERIRDVKMINGSGMQFRILAVENQNSVDYSMPFRCMQYDTMQYQQQLEEIKRKNEASRSYDTPAERLCRVKKSDRLWPSYTLCLYLGEDDWDGPRSLQDMMDFGEDKDGMSECFADYPFRLYCVNEEQDFSVFHTQIRYVFELLPYRRDKKKLLAKLEEVAVYERLDLESLEVLSVLLNLPSIWKNRKKYMVQKKDKGEYNVCQAIRELMEDSRMEGMTEGRLEGRLEGKLEVLVELVKEGMLKLEDAARRVNLTVEEFKEKMMV